VNIEPAPRASPGLVTGVLLFALIVGALCVAAWT
jgi:hypothetical protein